MVAARDGDHEADAQLVRAAFPRLYGVANLTLRDADRAQDAVQDALVLAGFDGIGNRAAATLVFESAGTDLAPKR